MASLLEALALLCRVELDLLVFVDLVFVVGIK
jgi:hypothetical protein